MKNTLKLIPLAVLLMLGGCVNLAPDQQKPVAPVEASWPVGSAYAEMDVRRQALPDWQEFYTDDRLKSVIEMGLENNRDLKIAALNVEKVRAQYRIQRSELLPTVAASADESIDRRFNPKRFEKDTSEMYDAQLGMASYEVDFFGRVRNMNEQALQKYLATDDARRSAQSALISEIAMMWLTVSSDRVQLELQQEILKSQEESFRMIQDSYRLGAASQLEYEQARTTVASARAKITSYIRAVAQDINALNLLCGTTVPENLLPEKFSDELTQVAVLPEGLPGEVLLNRPDIMAAERGLASAAANIGAARAAFLPRVTIVGGVGSGAGDLDNLFDTNTGYWTFVPSISIPIFTGGRNLANLEAAKVEEKLAVAKYEQAIQSAFREVADALALEGTIKRELAARAEYAEAATKAYELADISYKAGAIAYSEVLNSQRAMVGAKQALIATEQMRIASAVTLYKVLGGGATDVDVKTE